MAKVCVRSETGTLYLDFFYRGVRCREQTALPDTATNRKTVQTFLNRIQKEIGQGLFDYAATFPNSARLARFAAMAAAQADTTQPTLTTGGADPTQAPATPTFDEFSVTWRAEMTPQWRRLHRQSVDAIFVAHLLPAFGGRLLSSIAKADVLAFRAGLAKLPGRGNTVLTPSSINKIVGILRQCLTEASDRFGLPDTFKGVKRLKARRPDVQPFSMEEVERIRTTIRADYRHYVTVRFFTGMRTGEINGLKWKYVDFDRGLILVRETFADGVAEEDAKTEQSIRDIPMLPIVREALEEQRHARDPDSDYVFATANGLPIDAHNFANRVWYPLLRYLELDKRRPYQTRHTTATLMLAAGEKLWCYGEDGYTHMAQLGHELTGLAYINSPLDVLQHQWPDGAIAMRSLLSGLWKTKGQKPVLAIGKLVHPHVPVFTVMLVGLRHLQRFNSGELSATQAVQEVLVDGTVRAGLAVVGNYAGTTIGLLVFGPAGALVLGSALPVLSRWHATSVRKGLDALVRSDSYMVWDRDCREALPASRSPRSTGDGLACGLTG